MRSLVVWETLLTSLVNRVSQTTKDLAATSVGSSKLRRIFMQPTLMYRKALKTVLKIHLTLFPGKFFYLNVPHI